MSHRSPTVRSRSRRVPAFVAALALLGASAAADAVHELRMYTWVDYIDPALVAEFEREHDAVVRFDYFESDEDRDLELARDDGGRYDVLMMSDTRIAAAGRRGWIVPIERDSVPNARHAEARWADAVPGALEYGVPYLRGSMGIAWREDLVGTPPTSWSDLLEPEEALSGRILMDADARQLFAVALKADGRSANGASGEEAGRAGTRLLAQREHVLDYGYPGLGSDSSLVTGEVHAAMLYSGDLLTLQAHEPALRFTLPEEGGLLWVDYLTVGARSTRKPLAHAFIDFLTRPANAARLATHLHYATTNGAARALLPDDFLTDPIIYPSSVELDRSEFVEPLSPRVKRHVNIVGSQLVRR